jgi:alkylation response protein AidB-like acyl-CoA dehydrogenase
MIDFAPNEEQQALLSAVRQFARTVLAPRLRETERLRGFAPDVQSAAIHMGLSVAAIPESAGGSGLAFATRVLLEEELAAGDPAAAYALAGPGAYALAVGELCDEGQTRQLLAPFVEHPDRFGAVAWGEAKPVAERAGFATTGKYVDDGYTINGVKSYVAGGSRADSLLVFAQVDDAAQWEGIGAFVVPRHAHGVSVERASTLGLDAADFSSVRFDQVRVPHAARLTDGRDLSHGSPRLLRFFVKNALLVAARCTGLQRAAIEVTRDYVQTRTAFGKPIGHFQAVAFNISDRFMDLEASRLMVHRAAFLWDAEARGEADEREALLASVRAIASAQDGAMRAGNDAVQLHGGAGFMRDYPVEKYMRDAKQLQVCGLTTTQADAIAARIELGLPLEWPLLVPSAESQNVFV